MKPLPITLCTIGFAGKSAETFFTRLHSAGVKRIVDTRLNNRSQLAGFTKKDDLRFFLKSIGGIDYVHLPELAPTQDMLDDYKKHKGEWVVYETRFLELLNERQVEKSIDPAVVNQGCLLCSEDKATHCHRRLVAEYLQKYWGKLEISHL